MKKICCLMFIGWLSSLAAKAQLNPVPVVPTTEAPQTNVSGVVQVEESAGFKGTFQNTGINYASAMKVRDGFIVRVKRMVKPGDDTAKEIIGNIPVVSTVANVFTLGLFKRAMRPTGANMRATWMAINCDQKSFDVSNDGYRWQDIYNDAYAQAEELYYQACEPSTSPPYYQLRSADYETISKTGIESLEVFPDDLIDDAQHGKVRPSALASCDHRLKKYNCSWSAYLDANPSVQVWAENNPEMAEREKISLGARD